MILGGGLAGCAVAASLSRYNLNIAVIERNFDIAEDVAQQITTFVTDGTDIDDENNYKLLKDAYEMMPDLTESAHIFYEQHPSLSVYERKADYEAALDRISRRGIKGACPMPAVEAQKLTPHISKDEKWIIHHENTGIISPYDSAAALGEIAFENGVRFRMEEEVTAIERVAHDEVRVTTNKSKYSCRVVVITAFNDLYLGSGEYRRASRTTPLHSLLLDKNFERDIGIMLNVYKEDGFVSSIMPSHGGKTLAAIKESEKLDYKSVKKKAEEIIGPFPSERVDILRQNSFFDDPVRIIDLLEEKGYINLEAKNHNLPVMLINLIQGITDVIVGNFKAGENPDFVFKRRDYFRFQELTDEEKNQAIQFDSRFGHMICTCANVTEGEIVNAIRRPLGARTIEGVKRRTGITFGSCQGSYCLDKILKILAQELGKKPEEILNDTRDSKVLTARIKEFDQI